MNKVVIFAFNGEMMCFVHALLNALDLYDKGYEVQLVIEGSATKLISELNVSDTPFSGLYRTVKEKGILAGVCKACSAKMGTLEAAQSQGLTMLSEMSGHPGFSTYLKEGFHIITL